MVSGSFDFLPVWPHRDRFVGWQHVSVGAHCGQSTERGTETNVLTETGMHKLNLVLVLQAREILELTPVRQLVSLKWNLYGKHYFRWDDIRKKVTFVLLHPCLTRALSSISAIRLLLLLYLLYIGTFTLCCTYRPLKDIPENYTKSDTDKTIRIQKTLQVCVTH